MTKRRRALLLLAASALVAATIGATFSLSSRDAGTPAVQHSCVTEPVAAPRHVCFAAALTTKPDTARVRALLAEIDEAYRAGAMDDCHFLVHEVGEMTARRVPDVRKAIRMGNGACLNGYVHAVAQALVRFWGERHHHRVHGAQHVAADCEGLRNLEIRDACVHGVGHGLFHGELAGAVNGCAITFVEERLRTRCRAGVMMENAMGHGHAHPGGLRAAATRCTGARLTAGDRATCFEQIGEIAMMHRSHDFERARTACSAVDGIANRAACLQGALRELALWRTTRA